MRGSERDLDTLVNLRGEALNDWLLSLSAQQRAALDRHWLLWARPEQLPPPGGWHTWLICAGRGFGKTRAGAEWVRMIARTDQSARIALVGASFHEVRSVMVEGESGILRVSSPSQRPRWEPSLRRLTWPGGAQAFCYSAGEPESLRGPQHGYAWCDEIGKWETSGDRATAAWDNLLLGLRLGERPRLCATTTPRAVPLVRRLLAVGESADIAITRGSMYDNKAHLPQRFVNAMRRQFGKTTLGRQELDGELLTDMEGALWTRELLEECRQTPPPLQGRRLGGGGREFTRVVIGVDPPASARGDACGIVACGLDADGFAWVLSDASVERASPEKWARRQRIRSSARHVGRGSSNLARSPSQTRATGERGIARRHHGALNRWTVCTGLCRTGQSWRKPASSHSGASICGPIHQRRCDLELGAPCTRSLDMARLCRCTAGRRSRTLSGWPRPCRQSAESLGNDFAHIDF